MVFHIALLQYLNMLYKRISNQKKMKKKRVANVIHTSNTHRTHIFTEYDGKTERNIQARARFKFIDIMIRFIDMVFKMSMDKYGFCFRGGGRL